MFRRFYLALLLICVHARVLNLDRAWKTVAVSPFDSSTVKMAPEEKIPFVRARVCVCMCDVITNHEQELC